MTRKELALTLLREAGPRGVTTAEFLDGGVGSRYSARVRELRQQGHPITSERIREGSWRYTLEDLCPQCKQPKTKSYCQNSRCAARGVDADVGGGERGGVSPQRGPAADEQVTADVSAALFSLPDAYEELRAKDVA